MKKYFLVIIGSMLCFGLNAQSEITKNKIHEIGLRIGYLSGDFGASYHMGNEHILWRNRLFTFSGSQDFRHDTLYSTPSSHLGIGIATGIEFREGEQFQFKYGLEARYRHNQNKTNQLRYDNISSNLVNRIQHTKWHSVGLGFILGANYIFKDKWVLGFETIPNIALSSWRHWDYEGDNRTDRIDEVKRWGLGYNLSNTVALSVAYRLGS